MMSFTVTRPSPFTSAQRIAGVGVAVEASEGVLAALGLPVDDPELDALFGDG